MRSPAPACVRREAVHRLAAPAGLVSGAGPRRCGAVCCHVAIDWYASLPPRARWSLSSCMARFFEAAAAGVRVAPILCANQSAVSLGWFWAMTRSYPMTRSAATSCSPSSWRDLDARRSHWSRVIWTSRPIAIRVESGICAERSSLSREVHQPCPFYFELRVSWVVMGISTVVHLHLCVRVPYACVQYLYGAWAWAAYSPLDRVYGQS